MDFRHLYTTFDGRINRKPFWMGAIVLFIVAFLVSLVVVGLLSMISQTLASLVSLLISLVLLYPSCALGIKRLHDRGKSGRLMAVFIAPNVIFLIADMLGLTSRDVVMGGETVPVPTALGGVLLLVSFVVAIWALIELGIRKGTPGPNAYGADPLAPTPMTSDTNGV